MAALVETAEKDLHTAMDRVGAVAGRHFEHADYEASLTALAGLRSAVDGFFESVMVNAEDPALRNNRLWLLNDLHTAMNRVADLSKLAA